MMDISHNLHIQEAAEVGNNHPKKHTVVCRHFKRGKCLLGSKCAFIHEVNKDSLGEDVERLCSGRYTWGD